MTGARRPVGEDDLTALVDGELSAERRALVEEWLTGHPQERARIEADLRIRRQLADVIGPLADASLPDRLRVDAIRARRRARRIAGAQRLAAAVALVGVGIGAGWALRGATDGPARHTGSEVAVAAAAHSLFVAEKLHPVEVSAEAREHLGTWLGNRIGKPVAIPDLSGQGLTLIGGRLLPGADGVPAGQLMYETRDGQRVTLFLQGGGGDDTTFAFAREGDIGTLAWRSPDLAYVLSGPVDRDMLMRYAHAVHAANL